VLYNVAADFIVLLHFLFIVFVLLGGFLVFKWRWIAWLHLPAVIWGALIVMVGWVCPLTPIENRLRQAAGDEVYLTGFIEHYLGPVIYPSGLKPEIFIAMGVFVIVVNVVLYRKLYLKCKRKFDKTKETTLKG